MQIGNADCIMMQMYGMSHMRLPHPEVLYMHLSTTDADAAGITLS